MLDNLDDIETETLVLKNGFSGSQKTTIPPEVRKLLKTREKDKLLWKIMPLNERMIKALVKSMNGGMCVIVMKKEVREKIAEKLMNEE